MSEVFQFWIALALKVKDSCKDEAHNARDSSDNAYRRVAQETAKPPVLPDAHETHHNALHFPPLRRPASEAKPPDRPLPGLIHQCAPSAPSRPRPPLMVR